jgi:hypothetical protein
LQDTVSTNRLEKGVIYIALVAMAVWLACALLSLGELSGVTSQVLRPTPGQDILEPGGIWTLNFGKPVRINYPAQLRVMAAMEKEAVHLVLKNGPKQVAPASRSGNYVYFMVESKPVSSLELFNLGDQPLKLESARLRNYLVIKRNAPRLAVLWSSEAATEPGVRMWLLTLAGLGLALLVGLKIWEGWSGVISPLPLLALMVPPLALFGAVVVIKALDMHLELTWDSICMAGIFTPLILIMPRVCSWFKDGKSIRTSMVCGLCLALLAGTVLAGFDSEKRRSLPGGLVQMLHLGKHYLKETQYLPGEIKLERVGYDGQFFYYMAQDPLAQQGAWRNLDSPSYRFQRILFPGFLYLITGGDKESLPLSMLMVNLAALLGIFMVLCLWCRDLNISRLWGVLLLCNYGVIYPAFVGLSEPVANFLLVLSLYLLWYEKAGWAAFSMALMVLCKEYYILLPGAALVWVWVIRGKGRLAYAIPLVVGAAWQLAIYWRFGVFAFQQSSGNFDWPLLWLVRHLMETPYPSHIAFCVATLLLLATALWCWIRGPISKELVLLSLFLLLPLAAGPSIWASENGFMRVFSPAYLIYLLVVMGDRRWVTLIPAVAFAVHAVLQINHM